MRPAEPTPARAAATPGGTPARGDIQGLRAIAVGTVVASHAAVPGLAGGYVGVDVFFVISGFLITGILVREVSRTGRISVLDFYARRARRILPAAALTLVGVTIACWALLGYARLSQVLHDITWASLFGANIDFARSGSDYFANDTFVSPVQHYWSLAVEEQFYLFWPALIALVALIARGRVLRTLGFCLLGLGALSFAWSIHQTAHLPTSAYFSTFTRAWELGVGAMLALSARHVRLLTRGFLTVTSWLGLAMIAWSCLTYSTSTPFPGHAALVPVLGSALVLAGGMRPTPYGASYLLDRRPMRWLGDLSFSLYLVHWPLLTIPVIASGVHLGPAQRVGLVALSVALAALSYRYVETPFRTRALGARTRNASLRLWPAATGLVLALVAAVSLVSPTPATAARIELDPLQGERAVDVRVAVDHAAARAQAREPLPRELTPSPLDLVAANWRLPTECWAGTEATEHQVCEFGDPTAHRTLVLYGDSHMGMWTAPIAALAKKAGWRVDLFLKTGCPPIDVQMWRPERSNAYTECPEWRTWAEQKIAALHPDRIIISGYTQSVIAKADGSDELPGSDGAAGTTALAAGMLSTLHRLAAITPDLTVISDTHTMRRLPIDCLTGQGATLQTCSKRVDDLTIARNAAWKQAAHVVGATWVDVDAWICARRICPIVVGNVVVYTDTHHLTRTFAAALGPLLDQALRL